MKRVFKYNLQPNGLVRLPKGAQILHIAEQHMNIQLWALVTDPDPDCIIEEVQLHIFGTGHEIPNPDSLEYFQTFIMAQGNLVFHVFKEKANEANLPH